MPSPFPGMDPYIEAPEVWSDFHGRLAEEISAALNEVLQPQYVARLTPRVSYEIVEIGESRSIRPDVGVWQSPSPSSEPQGGVALVAAAPVESAVAMELPLRLYTVEVCETDSMRLVTAIEVLSPVNKRRSHEAYHEYLRKRRELLRSDAHLVEIDLLRGGDRPPLERPVPVAPYYVTVSRASPPQCRSLAHSTLAAAADAAGTVAGARSRRAVEPGCGAGECLPARRVCSADRLSTSAAAAPAL